MRINRAFTVTKAIHEYKMRERREFFSTEKILTNAHFWHFTGSWREDSRGRIVSLGTGFAAKGLRQNMEHRPFLGARSFVTAEVTCFDFFIPSGDA